MEADASVYISSAVIATSQVRTSVLKQRSSHIGERQ
jgi:hypothetical protein